MHVQKLSQPAQTDYFKNKNPAALGHVGPATAGAADEYKKALVLNPSYVDIRTELGVAYREERKLEKSLKELKQAVKEDPRYVMAHIQPGVTCYSMGRLKEAKKEWETVLQQDPSNESAKLYLRLCEKAKA